MMQRASSIQVNYSQDISLLGSLWFIKGDWVLPMFGGRDVVWILIKGCTTVGGVKAGGRFLVSCEIVI